MMPKDLKQLRYLHGGLSYYREFLAEMAERIRPITSLLKKGVNICFHAGYGRHRPKPPRGTFSAPNLGLSRLGRGRRQFSVLSLFTVMLVSTVLEPRSGRNKKKVQSDLLFSSAVGLSSLSATGRRSISRLAASSGAFNASADICGVPPSALFRAPRHSKASSRLRNTTPASSDLSSFSQRTVIFWNTGFLSRLPLPASEDDRSGRSRLTPSEEARFYLIRSGGLSLADPPRQRLGLGGLAPFNHSVGLGGFPLSRNNYHDFREHGPRIKIGDFKGPYGEFVARAPTSVFPTRCQPDSPSRHSRGLRVYRSRVSRDRSTPHGSRRHRSEYYLPRARPIPCPKYRHRGVGYKFLCPRFASWLHW